MHSANERPDSTPLGSAGERPDSLSAPANERPDAGFGPASEQPDSDSPRQQPGGAAAPGEAPPSGSASVPATRVSDAEREEVALALRRACSEGRLTIDELSERLGLVYAARTRAELDATRADLPVERAPGVPAKRRRWLVSLIGGLCAREAVAPEHTIMVGLIGGTELDLSAAAFVAPVTTITSVQLIGGVSVKVPENAVVELSGFTLIGGNDNRVPAVSREPGTPIVRVRLFGLIGGSEARVKRRALPR